MQSPGQTRAAQRQLCHPDATIRQKAVLHCAGPPVMHANTTWASEPVGGSESEHCRAGRSLAGRAGRHLARRLQQPVRGRDRLTGACIRGQPGLRAGQALAGGGGARRAVLDQVARVCRRSTMVSRAGRRAQHARHATEATVGAGVCLRAQAARRSESRATACNLGQRLRKASAHCALCSKYDHCRFLRCRPSTTRAACSTCSMCSR